MPRDDSHPRTEYCYFIGNDSILTERDRADVQGVVDNWISDWNALANVSLADKHTIMIVVCGELASDQQSRLSKEILREAERIEGESLARLAV